MTNDWVELCATPIGLGPVEQFVAVPEAGGIALFLGTTRSETDASGRRLAALEYQAYSDMALAQMRDLAAAARQKWIICRVALLHRTGRVALAEPSVIVAVACPHRAEAFEACRWLIDSLKAQVTIWKKELWERGEHTWVGGNEPQDPPAIKA